MRKISRPAPASIYNSYRLLLALLLLGFALMAHRDLIAGQAAAPNFLWVSGLYLILAIALSWLSARWTLTGLIIDIAAIIMMSLASGGLAGSLAVLMLVVVASANILLPIRQGWLLAALATLSLLGIQLWVSLYQTPNISLTAAGLLGLAFFATSLLLQQLVRRLNDSEKARELQRQAIVQLEALNQQIVNRLRTGLLVFDHNMLVITANPAAQLFFESPLTGNHLPQLLIDAHLSWCANSLAERPLLKLSPQLPALRAGFTQLQEDGDHDLTLVFLEDEARTAQEAQHLKLASLGRMSAIIAHEIRNPLSAIQHATDLLAEEDETVENTALFTIIRNHVKRVNDTIGGILDLSRQQPGRSQQLLLREQLQLARDHLILQGQDGDRIHLAETNVDITIRFSQQQLQQLLENLIANALRHGGETTHVYLEAGTHAQSQLPWLRVRDTGCGIAGEARQHIFEPFFSTARNGTGLGLYLCRELCAANQAQLELENANYGTVFMITFSHPDRRFL